MKYDYQRYYDHLIENNLAFCITPNGTKITITDCVNNIETKATMEDVFADMEALGI